MSNLVNQFVFIGVAGARVTQIQMYHQKAHPSTGEQFMKAKALELSTQPVGSLTISENCSFLIQLKAGQSLSYIGCEPPPKPSEFLFSQMCDLFFTS